MHIYFLKLILSFSAFLLFFFFVNVINKREKIFLIDKKIFSNINYLMNENRKKKLTEKFFLKNKEMTDILE